MEKVACPYCGLEIPISNMQVHINSHDYQSFQSDEEYAKFLAAQEEQTLSETAALQLVENDVQKRERYEIKSPLSSVITSTEQLALAMKQSEEKEGEKGKGPTAREFDVNFLSFVDTSHRSDTEAEEISQVVLFDIDNCGGEFEQIADAFLQMPKIIVYVVGGPGLPNVANVKLPTFAEMHQTKRLHIIPMMKKGKNAADFVLSFYGGMLHERLPLQIPFVVVSRDKGLQHLVEHLGLLGRAAKLISGDIVKHLSVRPIIINPSHTSTTTTTTTTTTYSSSNTNNNNTEPNKTIDIGKDNKSDPKKDGLDFGGNPFAENASEFTLEQAVWFVVSGISKTEEGQRPKTRAKLENVVGSFLKRIPGKKVDSINNNTVINGMQDQNLIVLEGSKVLYLF